MKIAALRATLVAVPYIEALRGERPGGYRTVIVEVKSDEGLSGVGECGMAGSSRR